MFCKDVKTLNTFILIAICTVLFLALLPYVEAGFDSSKTCEVGTSCDFTVFLMNRTNQTRFVNVASCNVSIFSNTDYSVRLLNNQSMTQPNASFGLFNYTYTFTSVGHYPAYVGCNGVDVMILSSGHKDEIITTTLGGTISVLDEGGDLVDYSIDVVNTTQVLNNTGLFTASTTSDYPIAVIVALLTVVGVLSYYAVKLTNLNEYARLLLFFIAFLVLMITINVAVSIVEIESSTSTDVISLLNVTYQVLLWIFLFIFGIMFIFFLFNSVQNWNKRKGDRTP